MSGVRCAFMHPESWFGQCSRFVPQERTARGDTLCSVHDPACKARTLARNAERRARRPDVVARTVMTREARSRLIAEIQELPYLWDGAGTEGRCV